MSNKTMYEGKEIETMDVTPTWVGILAWYIRVLESGTKEGKEIAKKELYKMARVADMYVESTKEKK